MRRVEAKLNAKRGPTCPPLTRRLSSSAFVPSEPNIIFCNQRLPWCVSGGKDSRWLQIYMSHHRFTWRLWKLFLCVFNTHRKDGNLQRDQYVDERFGTFKASKDFYYPLFKKPKPGGKKKKKQFTVFFLSHWPLFCFVCLVWENRSDRQHAQSRLCAEIHSGLLLWRASEPQTWLVSNSHRFFIFPQHDILVYKTDTFLHFGLKCLVFIRAFITFLWILLEKILSLAYLEGKILEL